MKKLIGTIIDSFQIQPPWTVLILSGDHSRDVNFDDMIEIELKDKTITAKLQDGIVEDGKGYGVEKITSMKIVNQNLKNEEFKGRQVFRVDSK